MSDTQKDKPCATPNPVPSHTPVDADGKPIRMCCACKETKSIRVRICMR